MKILITGIHGFVGSNLVNALKGKHILYGLDIVAPEKDGVVKTYSWDDLGKRNIPEVDAIIHLAGKAHDTKNQSKAQVYFDINTGLTQKIYDYFLGSSAKKFVFFSSVKAAAEAVSWHYRRFGGELEAEQVKSGLAEFDYVTGGFHNTELTIVAGRPSDGKTAVTLQMALNAARAGKSVCFFSLEMSSLQMLNRVLAGMTDVNPDHLRINKPTGRELGQLEEAALRLKDLPFYLDYTVGATVEQIRAKVLLQCRLGKCDLVVVDYLHLLGGDRRKGETQEQMVGRNVRALKQLALDSNCPVLTVSQMNRACEARADKAYLPVMSDLRDSGTIEQVADCVAFIYRPERYGFTRDEKTGHSLVGVGKIYIAKNRNGSTGIARFRYNPSFTRITDYIQPGTQTSLGL